VTGDQDFFALLDLVQQLTQLVLRLESPDLARGVLISD